MLDNDLFLGRGWSFPPSFSSGGSDIETVAGVEDIHQSLHILLSTTPEERVMHPDFGCDLDHILFEEVDQGLVNTLTQLISDAILYYEPRVTLNDLDVTENDAEHGLLLIKLTYTVRSTNSRFNMVYPFYLNEARLA